MNSSRTSKRRIGPHLAFGLVLAGAYLRLRKPAV